jgi:predicted transposase/invertase (TIGR01784 family)
MDKYVEGKAEGKAEGIAEGKAEEKRVIAKNLLEQGIAIDVIAASTGLTSEKINRLKDSIGKDF